MHHQLALNLGRNSCPQEQGLQSSRSFLASVCRCVCVCIHTGTQVSMVGALHSQLLDSGCTQSLHSVQTVEMCVILAHVMESMRE